ncbi:hypothetical protein BC829DRAFT_407145 [Chytridium lagenaria]|nr:hypothetical protein BC829DRAFT_407145 [Chytridium lagenaria]
MTTFNDFRTRFEDSTCPFRRTDLLELIAAVDELLNKKMSPNEDEKMDVKGEEMKLASFLESHLINGKEESRISGINLSDGFEFKKQIPERCNPEDVDQDEDFDPDFSSRQSDFDDDEANVAEWKEMTFSNLEVTPMGNYFAAKSGKLWPLDTSVFSDPAK